MNKIQRVAATATMAAGLMAGSGSTALALPTGATGPVAGGGPDIQVTKADGYDCPAIVKNIGTEPATGLQIYTGIPPMVFLDAGSSAGIPIPDLQPGQEYTHTILGCSENFFPTAAYVTVGNGDSNLLNNYAIIHER